MLHVAWQLALYCPLFLLLSFLRLFSFFGYHQINILINSEGSLLSQLSLTWTQVHFGHTLQLQSALKSIQFEFKTHFIALHCSSNCLSNLSVSQSGSLAICPSASLSVSLSGCCNLPRCPRTWGCRSSRDYYPILSRHLYRRASIASSNRYL